MTSFPLFNRTIIRLNWLDRLRVFYGGQILVQTRITLDKEVEVQSTSQLIQVEPIFPVKQIQEMVSSKF